MINGVPYPINVKDEKSLQEWLASIVRETEEATGPSAFTGYTSELPRNDHRELMKSAYFKHGDADSEAFAKALVCQQLAIELFSHLINAPGGKIVWRIKPEFDTSLDTIPADVRRMGRGALEKLLGNVPNKPVSLEELKKMAGKDDWAVDFTTDSIYQAAAPFGEWRTFKSYARYSIVVGKQVISPKGIAA